MPVLEGKPAGVRAGEADTLGQAQQLGESLGGGDELGRQVHPLDTTTTGGGDLAGGSSQTTADIEAKIVLPGGKY